MKRRTRASVRGRTAIVTGSRSGIGAELTERLLAGGCNVLACDILNEAGAEAVSAPSIGRRLDQSLDVRDDVQWAAAFAAVDREFGGADMLFNVAGVLVSGYVNEQTAAQVDLSIDVNLKGTIHGSRHGAAHMIARGHGSIVNVASLAGVAPIPGLAIYSASKFGVRGYTLAIRQELASHGVLVSVVCPDAVETPMLEQQVDCDAAAMTFSGGRTLGAGEVAEALIDAALAGTAEVLLPKTRGVLARLSSFAPAAIGVVHPIFVRVGARAQKARRR